MKDSKIAWTDHTFNPWWGCVKVSEGCKECYAATFAKRTGNDVWGVDAPRRFFQQKHWNEPLKWNAQVTPGERERVFCASMADVFETHKNTMYQLQMNDERERLAWTISNTPNLDWLLLTKRIESASGYLETMFGPDLPDNLWIGATCESQAQYQKRAPYLANIDAAVRFISVEPQLDLVEISSNAAGLNSIDWVICGGESGARCRPFDVEWARSLRDECQEADIAFFMKDDLPEDLRIREYPEA